eukprot:CFRG4235T1
MSASSVNAKALHGSHVFTLCSNDDSQNEESSFIQGVEFDNVHYAGSYEAIKASYALPRTKEGWKLSLQNKFPFTKWMPAYRFKDYFAIDFIAGITLSVMLIPQGVAFSTIVGVSPEHGLYTCVYPVLVYALMGSSRDISIGPFGLTSLMLGQGVTALLQGQTYDAAEYTAYVITTTFFVGGFLFLAGMLKLGFITIYMSNTVIRSFTTGAAIGIITSQLSGLFQIDTPKHTDPFANPREWWYVVSHLGNTNVWSICIGSVCMIFLYITKRVNVKYKVKMKNIPIPGELICVMVFIALCYVLKLDEKGVDVIGDIPKGLPLPSLPEFGSVSILSAATIAIPIAIVDYAVSVGVAKSMAMRGDYKISSNQEFIALGVVNIVGSFFQCFVAAVSLSRTSVVASIGAKSQVPSIVATTIIIMTIYFLTDVFYYLPKSVLSAIIILGLRGVLKQHSDIMSLWRKSKGEWLVWICTYLGTVIFGIIAGLIIGVALALLVVVFWISRPRVSQLGQCTSDRTYRDLDRIPNCKIVSGCLIWRFSASLWYCNSSHFRSQLLKQYHETLKNRSITDVIIDMGPVNNMDLQGAATVVMIHKYFEARKCRVLLANCKGPVRDILARSGYFFEVGRSERMFSSVEDAVNYHRIKPPTVAEFSEMGDGTATDIIEDYCDLTLSIGVADYETSQHITPADTTNGENRANPDVIYEHQSENEDVELKSKIYIDEMSTNLGTQSEDATTGLY